MRVSHKIPALFTGIALIVLTGCPSNDVMESKSVVQNEIYQYYSVSFDEESNETLINAEFRVAGPNGTTLVLSEPSDITCNGEELKIASYLLGGTYYTLSKSGPVNPLNFEFIDFDKKSYKNRFDLNTAQLSTGKVALSPGLKIPFTGPDRFPGEELNLEIIGDSLVSTIEANWVEKRFELTDEALSKFGKGEKLYLKINRFREGTLSEATSRGGRFKVSFTGKKIPATL
jgi:hypothetical protein